MDNWLLRKDGLLFRRPSCKSFFGSCQSFDPWSGAVARLLMQSLALPIPSDTTPTGLHGYGAYCYDFGTNPRRGESLHLQSSTDRHRWAFRKCARFTIPFSLSWRRFASTRQSVNAWTRYERLTAPSPILPTDCVPSTVASLNPEPFHLRPSEISRL